MYSAIYSSSETILGVNLWPKEDPVYLPMLSAAFFEFIPYDHCQKEQPQVSYQLHVRVCLFWGRRVSAKGYSFLAILV